MFKILKLSAALLLFSPLVLFAQNPYELLWEVSKPGNPKVSYVFGTMHISDPRVYDQPDSVLLALKSADFAAFEVNLNKFNEDFFEFLFGDGSHSIADIDKIGRQLAGRPSSINWTQYLSDPKKFRAMMNARKPITPDEDAQKGNPMLFLDASLHKVATMEGKEILALESLDSQLSILLGLQGDILSLAGDGSTITIDEMRRMYLKGDLARIGQLLDGGQLMGMEGKEKLIDGRNRTMAQRADSLFQLKPGFVAVGAAHLPGKEGVLELLKKLGYRVRPVDCSSKTGLTKNAIEAPYNPVWHTFTLESTGLTMRLPSKPYAISFRDTDFPLFAGLDFMGGIMYYHMSIPYADPLTTASKKSFAYKFYEAMSGKFGMEEEPEEVDVNGMFGYRFLVKEKGSYMRIQIVMGDHASHITFVGIDEKAIKSPFVTSIFQSVEQSPYVPLQARAWEVVENADMGFTFDFPKERHAVFEAHESTPDSKIYGTWTYSVTRDLDKQEAFLIVSTLPSGYFFDSIQTLFNAFVAELGNGNYSVEEQKSLKVHGYNAIDAVLTSEGNPPTFYRMILAGNRIFQISYQCAKDSPNEPFFQRHLENFTLTEPPLFVFNHQKDTLGVRGFFPEPVLANQYPEDDYWYSLPCDSAMNLEARDPRSSFSFSYTHADFGPYFRTDSLDTLVSSFEKSLEGFKMVQNAPYKAVGYIYAHKFDHESLDGKSLIMNRMLVKGNRIIRLRAQVLPAQTSEAERYFAAFFCDPPVSEYDWQSSKLDRIIQDLEEADSTTSYYAELSLGSYAAAEGDWEKLIQFLTTKGPSLKPFTASCEVMDKVAKMTDATRHDAVKAVYKVLKPNSDVAAFFLASLLAEGNPETQALGLSMLKADRPDNISADLIRDLGYSLMSYIAEHQDAAKAFDDITFMFDEPALEQTLVMATWYLQEMGEMEMRLLGKYKDRFQKLAADWIASPKKEVDDPETLIFEYQVLANILRNADPDDKSIGLIRNMLDLRDPELEEFAAFTLLEMDEKVEKSRLTKILSTPGVRFTLTGWLLEHEKTKGLPKKFFTNETLAVVSLEDYLQGYFEETPSKVEFVDFYPVYWNGESGQLAVLKYGMPGSKNWKIGFAGPFGPGKHTGGLYLDLTGTNDDDFPSDPSQIRRKVTNWESENREVIEEE